jgi:nucleotide-binding universal stress UspA family protein
MAIKSILCLVDGGEDSRSTVRSALNLAHAHDAHLEALHVELDPQYAVPIAADGMTATMIEDIVDTVEREGEKRAKAAEEAVRTEVEAAGLSLADPGAPAAPGLAVTFQQLRGREHDVVARRGMLHDLTVLTRRHGEGEPPATPTLETALMESGRPVLVAAPEVPETIGRRVAVAWRATVPGAHALQSALPLLAGAEAVTVITVDDGHSADADPAAVTRYLARHGIDADSRHVAARGSDAGTAILEQASDAEADLLVMGAYAHSRLRQFILGGVTSTVLRQAGLPLLLAH